MINSKGRLEYIAERRNKVLLVLYVLMAALAAIKLFLLLYGGNWHHYLLPFLLVVTGMSAAMTAYYINQNARSLIHRYNTHQQFITRWLVAFNER